MRQIIEYGGEPTIAPAIAPARSPPLEMELAQWLAAPEAVFEVILEFDLDQTANLTAEAGLIGWCTVRASMQRRSRNWSSARHWGGNPALSRWHMRQSIDRCGSCAGFVR